MRVTWQVCAKNVILLHNPFDLISSVYIDVGFFFSNTAVSSLLMYWKYRGDKLRYWYIVRLKLVKNADEILVKCMDHFVSSPRQWETMLLCNIVSHWLGALTKLSLKMFTWGIEMQLSSSIGCQNIADTADLNFKELEWQHLMDADRHYWSEKSWNWKYRFWLSQCKIDDRKWMALNGI